MIALTPALRAFLSNFFARKSGREFYLTGGTALAEFYLHHRASNDLDLFTQDTTAWQNAESDLKEAAHTVGAELEFRVARPPNELHRAFLKRADEADIRLDIVRDPPPYFGERVFQADGVIVDSLDNISVGKLSALCGRAYPRDFVDVYCLLHTGVDLTRLIMLCQEKDPGIDNRYVAQMMRQVVKFEQGDLPTLLKPINIEDLKQFFLKLANELVQKK